MNLDQTPTLVRLTLKRHWEYFMEYGHTTTTNHDDAY